MGIRVIKTAVAVFISIALARALHLDNDLGAGLLSVLGIDITLRRSFRTVAVRIAASVMGLVLASFIFMAFGFQLWTLSLFVLVVYPVLARFKLADGIVTSSVLVFHIAAKQEVTLGHIGNEIALLTVGLGTASIINMLYMPKVDRKLASMRVRVDELFSSIFLHMADHLRDPSTVWDGIELLEAPEAIKEGLELARRARENKLFQTQDGWTPFFEMRRQHFDSIQRMIELLAQVFQTLPHGEAVARLFTGLADGLKSEYYAYHVEVSLLQLEKEFKQMPLPVTREEFEMRSALLQLCLELKTYLSMAKKVKKPFPQPGTDNSKGNEPDFVPTLQK